MKREVYTVRWLKGTRRWVCPQLNWWSGQIAGEDKVDFVKRVATFVKRLWVNEHVPTQLKVFGKHGRIQSEWTYGHDPKRFPG